MTGLCELERRIGYEFSDSSYVEAAFTHSSYVNEHKATDNERIEFLGDCVLNFIVGEKLFREDGGSEGALSARRSSIVSRKPLSKIVDALGLMDFLRVGAGVDKSVFSEKARSDLFEALVGAVYLDGGIDACRTLLDKIFFGAVEPVRDYITELETAADNARIGLEFVTESIDGGFRTTVIINGKKLCGEGITKQASRYEAARAAVTELNG